MSAIDPGMAHPSRTPYLTADPRPEPFGSAEEVWFWTLSALAARREGTRSSAPKVQRPCDPDDVLRCIDALYRQRRIDLTHARVMRFWGERRCAPNPRHLRERSEWRIWAEAMDRLDGKLRAKGIVG